MHSAAPEIDGFAPTLGNQPRFGHLHPGQARGLALQPAAVGDFPSRPVKLPWPPHTFDTGRVVVAQHHVGQMPLLTAAVYGVPRSQAHPQTLEDTERILEVLTKEVVMGRQGPRVIRADFNHPIHSSREIAVWQAQGWQEIQDLGQTRWSRGVEMTCKGASRHDYIWLSPEAVMLCCGAEVHHSFVDHVVLEAKFRAPTTAGQVFTWPRPATIPWHEVALEQWHASAAPFVQILEGQDPTAWFKAFSHCWEESVSAHVDGPAVGLPSQCKGRAARLEPVSRETAPGILRPSRPGEVAIASDMLGREVKRWFQQLRRLQSLRDALRSNKHTPQARLYPEQLWSSILSAKGFAPSFIDWWPRRVSRLHGAPQTIEGMPCVAQANILYDDFHSNYRKLEAWHLRRRESVLAAKHAESSKLLFASLRPSRPPPLDTLVSQHSFEVLAVDPDSSQVQLDGAPPTSGSSRFSTDGLAVQLVPVEGALCQAQVPEDMEIQAGDVIEQEQFISEPNQVFQEFIKLWQPRWNQAVSSEHWHRILNFTKFLRPIASFDFPHIGVAQWLGAVRRLKSTAARGPDAYARLDLLNMAPCYVEQLLLLLRAIEDGQQGWPQQLLQGLVFAVDKQNHKCGADAYRPIYLLSVIYRVWASIRTRQLLRALRQHVPDEMFGFIPGRETADMWILLQAQIELRCLTGQPFTGCMADVVKALNGLPRVPLLRAAARLGFPTCVLTPWTAFISRVQRRFLMGEAVSAPVTSTSTFIEGDPLSVTAMTVASVLFHNYMHHFEPRIQHASYVDNLSVTVDSVYLAARGYSVMESFWETLGLQLDAGKTYFWATGAQDRRLLVLLGLTVAEHRRELGGFLTFGSRHRVVDMAQRIELVQPLWQTLRRSRAPLAHKWTAVTTKLWPIVFHGAAACWLSQSTVDKLRTKLSCTLGWTCAGAGPDLRALTEGPVDLDPAFYQIWCCLREFRRLASKSSILQGMWVDFMAGFGGKVLAGPFSTLLHHADVLGWGFASPPMFTDHNGLSHNFLQIPKHTLRRLVEDAWAAHVMRRQAGRAAVASLGKLDLRLAREVGVGCTGQQRSWLGMIRAGAAITREQQAKFDLNKTDRCLHCPGVDNKEHRLFDCPRYPREGLCRLAGDTGALRELLLPDWHEDITSHLRDLELIADGGWQWARTATDLQHVDIFTDGSCLHGKEDWLALGAWAVVCAQLQLVVASGHVQGLCQDIGRCELFAVLVALRWAADKGCGVTIWTDSQYVFDGMMQLLNGETHKDPAHPDLWAEIVDLLDFCVSVYIQLVPSHVDPASCDDPVAAFATTWNRVVGRQAGLMNRMRPTAFLQRHRILLWHRQQQRLRLRAIRDQYLRIAEATALERRPAQMFEDEASQAQAPLHAVYNCESFVERFPPNWFESLPEGGAIGPEESKLFVQRLLASDEGSCTKYRVTWIELVFCLVVLLREGFQRKGRTLAFWVSSVRRVMRPLLVKFGARGWLFQGSVEGVAFPVEALTLGIDSEDLQVARNLFKEWRCGRLINRIADLARPL